MTEVGVANWAVTLDRIQLFCAIVGLLANSTTLFVLILNGNVFSKGYWGQISISENGLSSLLEVNAGVYILCNTWIRNEWILQKEIFSQYVATGRLPVNGNVFSREKLIMLIYFSVNFFNVFYFIVILKFILFNVLNSHIKGCGEFCVCMLIVILSKM